MSLINKEALFKFSLSTKTSLRTKSLENKQKGAQHT